MIDIRPQRVRALGDKYAYWARCGEEREWRVVVSGEQLVTRWAPTGLCKPMVIRWPRLHRTRTAAIMASVIHYLKGAK